MITTVVTATQAATTTQVDATTQAATTATQAAATTTIAATTIIAATTQAAATTTTAAAAAIPAATEAATPATPTKATKAGAPTAPPAPQAPSCLGGGGAPAWLPAAESVQHHRTCEDVRAWAREAVAEQLAPWAGAGITERMFASAAGYEPRVGGSSHIEVKDGKVKGDSTWAEYMDRAAKHWPFRAEDLKDFRVVAPNGDWPFLMKADPKADPARTGPALTNANNGHFYNILMPVQSRPQFQSDFPKRRQEALKLGARVPWDERADLAIWRGNLGCAIGCGRRGGAYFPENHAESCSDDSPHWDPNTVGFVYGCGEDASARRGAWMNHYRVRLVNYSLACGEQCGIDARFPDIGGEHRPFVESYLGKDGIRAWLGGYVDDAKTAGYRYVFHVGNNGYADRSWRMFALGATVLLVDNGWKEWYFSLLKPYVHYIPIRHDASDACEKLRWARANPDRARAIAAEGRAFVETCLSLDLVNLYCAEVMRQLGALWERGHNRSGR